MEPISPMSPMGSISPIKEKRATGAEGGPHNGSQRGLPRPCYCWNRVNALSASVDLAEVFLVELEGSIGFLTEQRTDDPDTAFFESRRP